MTRSYAVTIDNHGWAQAKSRPLWRPSERARTNARRCLPWTLDEDCELLGRVTNENSIGYADPTIRAASIAHGRSTCAIATRVCALRAGIRQAATPPTKKKIMATETRTRTRYRNTASGTSVNASTKQRPKTAATEMDKVKTTGRKKPTVRAVTPTTTRRGNSTRTTRR